MCSWPSLLEKYLFRSFAHFKNEVLTCLLLSCKSSFYSFPISMLLVLFSPKSILLMFWNFIFPCNFFLCIYNFSFTSFSCLMFFNFHEWKLYNLKIVHGIHDFYNCFTYHAIWKLSLCFVVVVQSLSRVWLFATPQQVLCPSLTSRVCSNSCPLT